MLESAEKLADLRL